MKAIIQAALFATIVVIGRPGSGQGVAPASRASIDDLYRSLASQLQIGKCEIRNVSIQQYTIEPDGRPSYSIRALTFNVRSLGLFYSTVVFEDDVSAISLPNHEEVFTRIGSANTHRHDDRARHYGGYVHTSIVMDSEKQLRALSLKNTTAGWFVSCGRPI